jgi:hypothetical protein
MNEIRPTSLTTGSPARSIAVCMREGKKPGLFWLGGLKSDMKGTKAQALDHWAETAGRACVRFDYSTANQVASSPKARLADGWRTVSRSMRTSPGALKS